jgi:hypothetical protein
MGKAVANLAAAVEGGDLKASIEILKAVGMYGDGTMNAIHKQDPDVIVRQQVEAELKRKGISENTYVDQLIDLSRNPAYRQRLAEVEAEIRRAYLDE